MVSSNHNNDVRCVFGLFCSMGNTKGIGMMELTYILIGVSIGLMFASWLAITGLKK